MGPSVHNMESHIVIWKPHQDADEYIVFLDDPAEYEKWKEDKSIALSRFIGQFSIFKSATSGHTGSMGAISKQEVENVFFGDDKKIKDKSIDAAIVLILEHGKYQKGNLGHANPASMNPARGDGAVRAIGGNQGR